MDWPGIGTGFVKIGIDWKGLGPVPIARQSMAGEFAIIHPPIRLGTIPYRALVPRLKGQMALRNGLKLALDCPGLAWIGMDWQGSVWIGRSENCVGIKIFTLDWHGLACIDKALQRSEDW